MIWHLAMQTNYSGVTKLLQVNKLRIPVYSVQLKTSFLLSVSSMVVADFQFIAALRLLVTDETCYIFSHPKYPLFLRTQHMSWLHKLFTFGMLVAHSLYPLLNNDGFYLKLLMLILL